MRNCLINSGVLSGAETKENLLESGADFKLLTV